MTRVNTAHRKNERGITIVLVAFSLLALLGMAALAIDVSTLYVAHGEAQRAADAAALAGARMFAASGYTSVSTPAPSTPAAADVCLTSATPGADAAANRQAEAAAAQNLVAGQPAAVQSIMCNTTAAIFNYCHRAAHGFAYVLWKDLGRRGQQRDRNRYSGGV